LSNWIVFRAEVQAPPDIDGDDLVENLAELGDELGVEIDITSALEN